MDAFYVGVELLDRPELVGRPVAVGGTGARGVVASASYEARAHGVRSAMPTAQARRLCPDLVVLAGSHPRYAEVSTRIMAIFADVTPLVEPLSLDEAFLDVTGVRRRWESPLALAAVIRERVAASEGLSCSVGIGPSKLVAKLASQAAKPRPTATGPVVVSGGVRRVSQAEQEAFLVPLPVGALWGVGPATERRLARLGVRTVGDLAALPHDAVAQALGPNLGPHLRALANGVDERPVVVERDQVSIGHEETYAVDLHERAEVDRAILELADGVSHRLRTADQRGRTVTLKVRFGDFRTVTRSRTVRAPTDDAAVLRAVAGALADDVDLTTGIRLLGISVTQFGLAGPEQLSFDDHAGDQGPGVSGAGCVGSAPSVARPSAGDVTHAIRRRFGHGAIGPAALVARRSGAKGSGGGAGGAPDDPTGDGSRKV
ncbi:MAG: DNA polymerase IV [Acidimicrobiia bacterium]|nr:DNA polymerase IV [Acidimicrobiia bacterium]